jgi:Flp pilus assembly protein TadG
MPILVPLYFGTLETCNVMLTQSRMQSAAYESARLATRPTTATTLAATASQVQSTCTSLLTQLGVQGATVTVSPSSLTGLAPQTPVTVTVSAPLAQNTLTSVVVGKSMTLSTSATMVVE